MAEGRRSEALIAHMIRDVFGRPKTCIYYGESGALVELLNGLEHGIQTFQLYTNPDISIKEAHHWEVAINDSFYGYDYCELFISCNYNPTVMYGSPTDVAIQLSRLMKHNGLVFLVNPGAWADDLHGFMPSRQDLVDELKSYHLLKDQNVKVYQNGRV